MTRLREVRQRNEDCIVERDGDPWFSAALRWETRTTHLEEDKNIHTQFYSGNLK